MECTTALVVMGPLLVGFGVFALYCGIMAWRRPESRFIQGQLFDRYEPEDAAGPVSRFFGLTRERAGPWNLAGWRILGPLNGTIFVVVGIWITVAQILCGFHLPDLRPLIGPVEVTYWAPSIPFIGFAMAIAVWRSYRSGIGWCIADTILVAAFAFAASEAAAYHVGIQANRWFTLAIVPLVATALLYWLRTRLRKT